MNHLHFTKDGSSSLCDCWIGQDHQDAQSKSADILYWTRRSMYSAWVAVRVQHDSLAIYPVWLKEQEKEQIIAIWEKDGILGSVVEKIRAAEAAKGIQ